MSFLEQYGGKCRGLMSRIPCDMVRGGMSLKAISKLLQGGAFSRSDLFGVKPEDQTERAWQKMLLRRMAFEGAIKAQGVSRSRKYQAADTDKLSYFKSLFEEKDPVVKKWGHGNTFHMTPGLLAVMDGGLLGDASYFMGSGDISASFVIGQREDRLGWLQDLHSIFEDCAVESAISPHKASVGIFPNGKVKKGRPSFSLRTRFYRNLKAQRERWYPAGKKIVPKDIDVSNPITLAHWYMGDGCAYKNSVNLSTNGFAEQDVQWLKDQMSKKLSIRAYVTHWRGQPTLTIANKHAEKFIEAVKPFMSDCFGYKISKFTWRSPTCYTCGKAIPGMTRMARYCDGCCSESIRYSRQRNQALKCLSESVSTC